MRLPVLLVVAKKTNELNIDCSLGEGVKLGSVALWEHLVEISGHSDYRLTSSNVLDMIEKDVEAGDLRDICTQTVAQGGDPCRSTVRP